MANFFTFSVTEFVARLTFAFFVNEICVFNAGCTCVIVWTIETFGVSAVGAVGQGTASEGTERITLLAVTISGKKLVMIAFN